MAFIQERNNFYGFVAAGGRRYSFELSATRKSPSSEYFLKVDWRLKRDLGESLNCFIKDFNKFSNPEEFYYHFCVFVQNNLKTRIVEPWLKNPLKTSVLVKCIQQEIEQVGEYIKHFDLKTGVVKIEVSDCQFRIHEAILKLSQNYKHEPINVVSHNLPHQRLGTQCNPNLDYIFSVAEFCEKFSELVTRFQTFWNTMALLDTQCCVLDPASPTFKDIYRRIKLNDTLSVVLTFNPFCPSQRPKIQLLGCLSDVNKYQSIFQKNLEDDVWDNEEDVLFNLSNMLEISIPSKIFTEELMTSNSSETGECAICFTWRLNDEIPNEMCENLNCKSIFHSTCLFTYFSSIPRNRDYFGKIQGECPNCDCTISCTVPKLM